MNELRAPFPYFGGKRRIADVVWRAFGPNVPNYIEPFAGSLAVLLGRPGGAGKIETVNDRDRYVANFWRAILADPWAVAEWADRPVNEADLHATHKWLVNQAEFRERMHEDPDFFDAKIAGLWVTGLCAWIGGGWCVEPNNRKHPRLDGIGKGVHADACNPKARNLRSRARPRMSGDNAGEGVHAESAHTRGRDRVGEANRPELAGAGKGVHSEGHRKRPSLDGTALGRGVHSEAGQIAGGALRGHPRPNLNSGQGVHAPGANAYSPGRRPAISTAGQGVHLPSLGNDRGIHGVAATPGTFLHALRELTVPDAPPCFEWFAKLALRLRRVRVACGDWKRVLGDSVLGKGKNVGGRRPCAILLDPPYSHEFRDPYLYSEDDASISTLVREWALDHGDDPEIMIALCGYEGEHEMPKNWIAHRWKGARGYAAEENANRDKETIWFSPHCVQIQRQGSLFA